MDCPPRHRFRFLPFTIRRIVLRRTKPFPRLLESGSETTLAAAWQSDENEDLELLGWGGRRLRKVLGISSELGGGHEDAGLTMGVSSGKTAPKW
jgi:hypothetical protein